MSAGVVALLFAVGVGAWVYSKASRSTGNQTRPSAIIAAVVGIVAFFVIYTALRFFIPK